MIQYVTTGGVKGEHFYIILFNLTKSVRRLKETKGLTPIRELTSRTPLFVKDRQSSTQHDLRSLYCWLFSFRNRWSNLFSVPPTYSPSSFVLEFLSPTSWMEDGSWGVPRLGPGKAQHQRLGV